MESSIFLLILGLLFCGYYLKERKAEANRLKLERLRDRLEATERVNIQLVLEVDKLTPKPQQFEPTEVDATNDEKLAKAVKSLQEEIARQHPAGPSFLSVLIEIEKSLAVIFRIYALKFERENSKE